MRKPSQPLPLSDLAQQIVDARDAAQYDKEMQLVSYGLKSHSDTPALRDLSDEILRDIKPDIKLHCLKHGVPLSVTLGEGDCEQLSPDDEFYFKVNLLGAGRQSYAYMFLVDSVGAWTVLLPNKAYAPNPNPLSPALYQVPDNIQRKLRPPKTPGAEKLFVVVANWRIDALEELAKKLSVETDPERAGALGEQLLKRLALEEAKPIELHGLKVGTKVIYDSGRTSVQDGEKR
jgi:hypothetical protein